MSDSKGHHSREGVVESTSVPSRSIESEELLGGANQIFIVHAGQVYTLRRTRENKLILTK
ncbi:MAG: hemin uptake protein HemP [Gammaproteobacteria bacterium]|nr:hemin uptake protein HemP [Gammaproteobacteria bacterium]